MAVNTGRASSTSAAAARSFSSLAAMPASRPRAAAAAAAASGACRLGAVTRGACRGRWSTGNLHVVWVRGAGRGRGVCGSLGRMRGAPCSGADTARKRDMMEAVACGRCTPAAEPEQASSQRSSARRACAPNRGAKTRWGHRRLSTSHLIESLLYVQAALLKEFTGRAGAPISLAASSRSQQPVSATNQAINDASNAQVACSRQAEPLSSFPSLFATQNVVSVARRKRRGCKITPRPDKSPCSCTEASQRSH